MSKQQDADVISEEVYVLYAGTANYGFVVALYLMR
jgi:hypothetical protein